MHKIIFFILLVFFPVSSSYAEALRPGAQGHLTIAQNTPDIELPTLPDTPAFTMPKDVEEQKADGDVVTPALPPLPVPDSAGTKTSKDKSTPTSPPPLAEAKDTKASEDKSILTPPPPLVDDTGKKIAEPTLPLPPLPSAEPAEKSAEAKPKKEADIDESKQSSSPQTTEKNIPPALESSDEQKLSSTPASATKSIAKCASLPESIGKCEAYSCEIPDFDKSFPGFIKTWTVSRKDGNICIYSESMPRNAALQCRLSEKSREAYAAYLDSILLRQKLITDTEVLDNYNNARKNECQIVSEDGETLDPKLYNAISHLPENVQDYGASDAPKGDCDTLEEKLKTCEPFYCKGNDPIQEKFFNRKVEIERKVIGWVDNTCIYVQKTAGKNLVGCKYTKTDGTSASQCSINTLAEIANTGTLFNKMTIAEKAAAGETTLKKPAKVEETIDQLEEKEMALSTYNYKTQILPEIIHKKQYDKQNKDLPVAYYPIEFKVMAFSALDRNDLVALKAFINKIKEIDSQLKKQKKAPLGGIEVRDDNGNTLLIRSVMAGNFMAARMLVGEGADADAQNNSGVTALHAAVYGEQEDLVTLLLGMGAKCDIADKYGRTALTHAIEKRNNTITKLLLSRNADPNISSNTIVPPLITATKLGNSSAVVNLLDNKANIDIRDSNRKTALMYAAESGNGALVNILIKRGANVFLQDSSGQTAEVLASKAGHTDIARILASAAIDKRLRR